MGENLGGGEGDGHLLIGHLHLGLAQVHPGGDDPAVGHDKPAGGEGNADSIEVAAPLKLAHIGVGVLGGGQLADLLELLLHSDRGQLRLLLSTAAGEEAAASATPARIRDTPLFSERRGWIPVLSAI